MTGDFRNILTTGFDAALTAGDPFDIPRNACADMASAPTNRRYRTRDEERIRAHLFRVRQYR